MEKKYRIRVTEGISDRTNNYEKNVIEDDYTGTGDTLGACVMNAENQAEADWRTKFLNTWRTSRRSAGKDDNFSITCLEFNIVRRY